MTAAERERATQMAIAAGHPSTFGLTVVEGGAGSDGAHRVGSEVPGRQITHRAPHVRPPSTWSDVVDAPPPRDAMSGDPDAAASGSTPFDDFHATVTDINDAADRLRVLLRRGSPDDAVEAHRDLSRGATSPSNTPSP